MQGRCCEQDARSAVVKAMCCHVPVVLCGVDREHAAIVCFNEAPVLFKQGTHYVQARHTFCLSKAHVIFKQGTRHVQARRTLCLSKAHVMFKQGTLNI